MYDFSTLEKKDNKQFHARQFNMSNEEDVHAYCNLMTKAHWGDGVEVVFRKDILSESLGTYSVYIEWASYTMKKLSPYAASPQHGGGKQK